MGKIKLNNEIKKKNENKNKKNIVLSNKTFFNKKTNDFEERDNNLVDNETGFENLNSDVKVKFNHLDLNDNICEIEKDGSKLSFKLVGKNEKHYKKPKKLKCKKTASKKIIYDDIFEDSDIEYEITENETIKENIIVKKNNKDSYEYEYEIKLENLTMKLKDDEKGILFIDSNEKTLFEMLAPVMKDSDGVESDEIEYEINKLSDDVYKLIIKTSSEWINSSERKLPIYIDPSIRILTKNIFEWYFIDESNYVNGKHYVKIEPRVWEKKYNPSNKQYTAIKINKEVLKQLVKNKNIDNKYQLLNFNLAISYQSNYIIDKIKTRYTQCLEDLKQKSVDELSFIENNSFDNDVNSSNLSTYCFCIEKEICAKNQIFIFDASLINPKDKITVNLEESELLTDLDHELKINPIEKTFSQMIELSDMIKVEKCMISKKCNVIINELQSIGNLSFSHIYSCDNIIPSEDRKLLFGQYGKDLRSNYSIVVYDGTYFDDDVMKEYVKGDYYLIDANNNVTKFTIPESSINNQKPTDIFYDSNNPTTTLKLDDNGKIFISNKQYEMIFFKVTNTQYYLLSSITYKSPIENKITIQYINETYISQVNDNRGNFMSLEYVRWSAGEFLSNVLVNGKKKLEYKYDNGKMYQLGKIDNESITNSRYMTINYGNVFYDGNDTFIYGDNYDEKIITNYPNKNLLVERISNSNYSTRILYSKIECNNRVISRYNEDGTIQKILLNKDSEVISSYILDRVSTEAEVLLIGNISYQSKETIEKEEGEISETISFQGSFKNNAYNILDSDSLRLPIIEAKTFNNKEIYKLAENGTIRLSTNIVLRKPQLNESNKKDIIPNNHNYVFGVFLKTLFTNAEENKAKLILNVCINGIEEELLQNTIYIKNTEEWQFVSYAIPLYKKLDNLSSIDKVELKITYEANKTTNDVWITKPLLVVDDSYQQNKEIHKFADGELIEIENETFSKGFKMTKKLIASENENYTNCMITIEDLITHKTSGVKETYNKEMMLVSKEKIEDNTFVETYDYDDNPKLLSKVTTTSKKDNSKMIQKYSHDNYGNNDSVYDSRGVLISKSIYNYENLVTKDEFNGLANKNYSYNFDKLKVITALNSGFNTYNCNFDYNKDELVSAITINNSLQYIYNYDENKNLSSFSIQNKNTSNIATKYIFENNLNSKDKKYIKTALIDLSNPNNEVYTRYAYYDDEYNITNVTENGVEVLRYEYQHGKVITSDYSLDGGNTSDNYIMSSYNYDENYDELRFINYFGYLNFSIYYDETSYQIDCVTVPKKITFSDSKSSTEYKYYYDDRINMQLKKVDYSLSSHYIFRNSLDQITTLMTKNLTACTSFLSEFEYIVLKDKDNTSQQTTYVSKIEYTSIQSKEYDKEISYLLAKYQYNDNGSIKEVTLSNKKYRYFYDDFGRISREDNQALGSSKKYLYDNYGNLKYIFYDIYSEDSDLYFFKGTKYSYDEFNRLTSITYNDGSHTIISNYDSNGNPQLITDYQLCASGTGTIPVYTILTYDRCNRLKTSKNSKYDVKYMYNENGIRVSKQANYTLHKYYVEGDIIHKEEFINTSKNNVFREIYYYYDETGVCALKVNDTMYYYIKDLTGSIIGIYNVDGKIVARYEYDAWGNHKVINEANTDIGTVNPFRYHGYYYDDETGLFYCNSRYYNPEWCRWLTPDSIDYLEPNSINGLNLYCYCKNNPVMYADTSGHFPWLILAAFIFVGLTRATANAIGQYQSTGKIDWTETFIEGLYGGVIGALTVATAGTFSFGALALRVGVTAVAMGIKNYALMYNDTGDTELATQAAFQGVLLGGVIGFLSYIISPSSLTTRVFISTAATGIGFGYLSGLKNKEQEIMWPWKWQTY